eukprot:12553276-Alexandrium_andersonii.AAC.1
MRALSNKCRGLRGNIQEHRAAHQLMLKILLPAWTPALTHGGPIRHVRALGRPERVGTACVRDLCARCLRARHGAPRRSRCFRARHGVP